MELLTYRFDGYFLRNSKLLGGAGRSGVIYRFDAPLGFAQIQGEHSAGLGDLYGQAILIPAVSRRYAFAIGSGLQAPTATDRYLGAGKWTLAPLAGPAWFFPKGMAFLKFQNFVSFAGNANRPDVNYLLVSPLLWYRIARRWWVQLDTDIMMDWENNARVSYKSGLQLGHYFGSNFGAYVKPEVWWGANRQGDWNMKLGFVWYR